MTKHLIRLRGPWEVETLDGAAAGKIRYPLDDSSRRSLADRGPLRFRRWFNAPTGLNDSTLVWLVIDDPRLAADVALNDQFLGTIAAPDGGQFDVTRLLQPRNELVITAANAAGLTGEVHLEIRASNLSAAV